MSKSNKKIKNPRLYDLVKRPLISEKSQIATEFNKITFFVDVSATKSLIKEAVTSIFNVEVIKINIMNVKGKVKRFRGTTGKCKDRKKAIVTLAEGNQIDLESTVIK